jgi:CBS domain-containing protein
MSQNLSIPTNARRLTIYIGESDRWRGKPLYAAILEALKAQGVAGATVLRGAAGFGAHSRIHTAAILRLSEDLPLRIEVVDSAEKVEQALELLASMVREGLVTVEEVQVVRYTHRFLNPLPADRLTQEAMTREAQTVTPEMTIGAAWEHMMATQVKAMPVVAGDRQVVGMLTDEDIVERSGVLLKRLGFAERLDDEIVKEELGRLNRSALRVGEIMSQPAVTVGAADPLGMTARRMAQTGLKRLPVLDEQGKLVGVISRLDIFRTLLDDQGRTPRKPPPQGAAQTVAEIMSSDVPVVSQDARLVDLVAAFAGQWYHRLIVVDAQGRAAGLVNDADLVARIQPAERRGVLQALQRRGPAPESQVTAADLMSPGVLTAAPDTTLLEAVRRMVSEGRKWIVVVDQESRPLGLVNRQVLLQAVSGVLPMTPG